MFGQQSEKLSPDQLALWRAEQQEACAAIEAELAQLLMVASSAARWRSPS